MMKKGTSQKVNFKTTINEVRIVKIQDRINLLEDEIKELNKNIELIDAAHKQATVSTTIFLESFKINKSTKENHLVLNKLMKEMNSTSNEWFRLNIAIIRRFSVKTAESVATELTVLESNYRELEKRIMEVSLDLNNDEKGIQFVLQLNKSTELFTQIDKKIKTYRQIIKDTLDRIKNFGD